MLSIYNELKDSCFSLFKIYRLSEMMMKLYSNRNIVLLLIFCLCFFYSCSGNAPPEKRALELAKDSYALDGDKPAYRIIEEFTRRKGDDVKPIGWEVEKKADNKYLVSFKYKIYSFNEGVGERGFFFEVDLDNGSVTDKTEEILENMKPLSSAYKNEKEIFREMIGGEGSVDTIEPD
jgi:hypothetical protein